MDKRKIMKIIISVCLFTLGTLGSLFISSYLHLILTKSLSEISIFGLLQAVGVLISEKKARNIFMILELGVMVLSIFYYFMKDNFYESELMTITPRIKIPVPAGQMQFGSARFINAEEMSNLFTTCKVNQKDKLMKELMQFGDKEYKKIRKVINQNHKEETKESVIGGNQEIDETNCLQIETKKEVETGNDETEKTYKYKIQEEISLFLENDIDILNYFDNTINIIDEMICLEKESKYQAIRKKIELMPSGDDKDKLIERLEVFLNDYSTEIEEEIDKIEDEEIKKNLKKLLSIFHREFNDKQKEYIQKIELAFISIEDISNETDLNKYMDTAKDLEKRIDRLPGGENKKELFNKLFDLMDKIILENNKKYEEIEKMLW